jgi:hypothetical protein
MVHAPRFVLFVLYVVLAAVTVIHQTVAQTTNTQPTILQIAIMVDQSHWMANGTSGDRFNDRFEIVRNFIEYLYRYRKEFLSSGGQVEIEVAVFYYTDQVAVVSIPGTTTPWLRLSQATPEGLSNWLGSLSAERCDAVLGSQCGVSLVNHNNALLTATRLLGDPGSNVIRSFIWLSNGFSCPISTGCPDSIALQNQTLLGDLPAFAGSLKTMPNISQYVLLWSRLRGIDIQRRWNEIITGHVPPPADGASLATGGVYEVQPNQPNDPVPENLRERALATLLYDFHELMSKRILISRDANFQTLGPLPQASSSSFGIPGATFVVPPMTQSLHIATAFYPTGTNLSNLRLLSPDGSVVEPPTTQSDLMELLTIPYPQPGTWQVYRESVAAPSLPSNQDAVHLNTVLGQPPTINSSSGVNYFQHQVIPVVVNFDPQLVYFIDNPAYTSRVLLEACAGTLPAGCSPYHEVILQNTGSGQFQGDFIGHEAVNQPLYFRVRLEANEPPPYSTQMTYISPFIAPLQNANMLLHPLQFTLDCTANNTNSFFKHQVTGSSLITVEFLPGDEPNLSWQVEVASLNSLHLPPANLSDWLAADWRGTWLGSSDLPMVLQRDFSLSQGESDGDPKKDYVRMLQIPFEWLDSRFGEGALNRYSFELQPAFKDKSGQQLPYPGSVFAGGLTGCEFIRRHVAFSTQKISSIYTTDGYLEVVIDTANNEDWVMSHLSSAGADDYILKWELFVGHSENGSSPVYIGETPFTERSLDRLSFHIDIPDDFRRPDMGDYELRYQLVRKQPVETAVSPPDSWQFKFTAPST